MSIDVPDFSSTFPLAASTTPAGLVTITTAVTGTHVLPNLTGTQKYRLWSAALAVQASSTAVFQQIGGSGMVVLSVFSGQTLSITFPVGILLGGTGLELDIIGGGTASASVAYDILPA